MYKRQVWGRGIAPYPEIFFDFGSQNGDLWCILGAVFCSSAKTLRGRKDTLAQVYFYWGGAIAPLAPGIDATVFFGLYTFRSRYWHCPQSECRAGSMHLTSVRPSVRLSARSPAAAEGLLLWARRAGDIDRSRRLPIAAAVSAGAMRCQCVCVPCWRRRCRDNGCEDTRRCRSWR